MTALLSIRDLSLDLPSGGDRARAVDGVSFDIAANEIVCLVGESGSGKSMTAHAILGLLPPKVSVAGGTIVFRGDDLLGVTAAQKRALRGGAISMIFQEPLTALNPVMRVGEQVAEAIVTHDPSVIPKQCAARVSALFGQVGLPDPGSMSHAYPFQLSGGQRQRHDRDGAGEQSVAADCR